MPSLVEIGTVFCKRRFLNFVNVFSLLSLLGKGWGLSCQQTWIPFNQWCVVPSLVEIRFWFWRRFFNFVNVFSLFRNYLPLGKGVILHLKKFESPLNNDALCQVWLRLAQWFWRRRFLNFVNIFLFFRNYIPLEKGGVLHLKKVESPSSKDVLCHLNKLEFPSPKYALCQVWLRLAQWFWRRRWNCDKFTPRTTTTTDNEQILIRKAH